VPIGAILPITLASSASLLPTGHLICNGQAVLRSAYPALFALITTSCGDGTTTPSAGTTISSGYAAGTAFNLPDMRGRFLRGNDSFFTSPAAYASRDLIATSARVNISVASPAVVIHNNHNFADNEPIKFSTGNPSSGSLPAPLGVGAQYYVKYVSKDTYQIRSTVNGAAINTSSGGTAGAYWCTPNFQRTASYVGGSTQLNPGTVQQDSFQGHWHYMNVYQCNGGEGSGGFAGWLSDEIYWGFQGRDMLSDGTHGSPRTAPETRPVNSSIIFTIRAF
jgi:microcystin-dependent protein